MYCLIGKKLGHSFSKTIHELNNLNYSLVELNEEELDSFFKNCEYKGFNVTIPYKKSVFKYLKEVSSVAKEIGAVNTIVNKNGEFFGYNTDIYGLEYMIERKNITLKDKNVLILGSGGTSLTCKTLCKLKGAKSINIVSRTGEINYSNCYELKDVNIIINTTPVGMFPNVEEKIIDIKKFKNLVAVFDCIYNPNVTELLFDAKLNNLVYSNGLAMLVEQGLKAEDIWLNTTHTKEKTESIIKTIKSKTLNIVLCGMPSCGKTTVANTLGKLLDRQVIDIDLEIEKQCGMSTSLIINTYGEEHFRKIESEVIATFSNTSSKIIATGGGAVLSEKNVKALKRNGAIVYLKRNLELLTTENRPLSQKDGIENLYKKRKLVYESVSDIVVENNSSVQACCKEIYEKFENSCN